MRGGAYRSCESLQTLIYIYINSALWYKYDFPRHSLCPLYPAASRCDEMGRYNEKIVLEGGIDCAKVCLATGIPVGLVTDTGCPFVTHYNMWQELHYFYKFCNEASYYQNEIC